MRKENFPAWVTEHTVSVGIQCCRTKSAMCTAQGLMSVNTEASRVPLIPHKCTLREFSVGEPQGQVACGRKYDARGWGCPVDHRSVSHLWVPVMFLIRTLVRLSVDYQGCCCSFWIPQHSLSAVGRGMKNSWLSLAPSTKWGRAYICQARQY